MRMRERGLRMRERERGLREKRERERERETGLRVPVHSIFQVIRAPFEIHLRAHAVLRSI
jgi:hypothetical protein